MRRPTIIVAILLAAAIGYVPVPVSAQGGDVAYRSIRTLIPIARAYLEPQGLQDASYDLLTADMSTMSSTYVTVLSGSVTVGEAGDAVTVHVTGQIAKVGETILYVADGGSDELWRIDDPTSPGSAVLEGSFSSGLTASFGITSQAGALYVVDRGTPGDLWRIDDPTNPGFGGPGGSSFPSGLVSNPNGITSHGGSLYVVGLWHPRRIMADRRPNGSGVGSSGRRVSIRSHRNPTGITSHGGALYVVDDTNDGLWRIDDPTNPGGAVLRKATRYLPPVYQTRKASRRRAVRSTWWTVLETNCGGSTISTNPGSAVLEGSSFHSGLSGAHVRYRTSIGAAPCMIRVARGTTEIEGVDI